MREEAEAIMKELKSLYEKINSIAAADEKDAAAQKFPEMFLMDSVVSGRWISSKSKVRPKPGEVCQVITLDGSEHLGFYAPQLSNNGVGAFSIDGIVFWNNVLAWKVEE